MQNIGYMLADNSRLLRRAFDERMRSLGVTGPQARLLLTLSRESGQNQGFYADKLEVEPITLCRMVDRLEEAGMVARERDPADRRAWRINMTPKAEADVAALTSAVEELVEEVLGGFSSQERSQLADYLSRIGGNLGARQMSQEAANG